MHVKDSLISVVVFSVFTGVLTESPAETCSNLMIDANLTHNFGMAVAHRLHSLRLEDVRYYFKEDAPEDNGIPVVNFDISPNAERVLHNMPLSGYDTNFKTIALRHTDQVLSKMNDKNWGIKHYTTVDELVHVHHMAELWEHSRTYYDNFVESPPTDELCDCLRDIHENFVMPELQLLALKIKFPGLTSGEPNLPYGKKGNKRKRPILKYERWTYDRYYFSRVSKARSKTWKEDYMKKLKNFDFDGDEEDVVNRAMKKLVDGDKGEENPLDDEEGWAIMREGFKRMDELDNYQFSMFMYCMLNE